MDFFANLDKQWQREGNNVNLTFFILLLPFYSFENRHRLFFNALLSDIYLFLMEAIAELMRDNKMVSVEYCSP